MKCDPGCKAEAPTLPFVGSQGLCAPLVLFMARAEFDGASVPLMRLDLAHKRGPPGWHHWHLRGACVHT